MTPETLSVRVVDPSEIVVTREGIARRVGAFVDQGCAMDLLQDLGDVEALLRVAVNAEGITEPDRIRVADSAVHMLRALASSADLIRGGA